MKVALALELTHAHARCRWCPELGSVCRGGSETRQTAPAAFDQQTHRSADGTAQQEREHRHQRRRQSVSQSVSRPAAWLVGQPAGEHELTGRRPERERESREKAGTLSQEFSRPHRLAPPHDILSPTYASRSSDPNRRQSAGAEVRYYLPVASKEFFCLTRQLLRHLLSA